MAAPQLDGHEGIHGVYLGLYRLPAASRQQKKQKQNPNFAPLCFHNHFSYRKRCDPEDRVTPQ